MGVPPISIVRHYDSLDALARGEFGYVWSLDVIRGNPEYTSFAADDDDFVDFPGYRATIVEGSQGKLSAIWRCRTLAC